MAFSLKRWAANLKELVFRQQYNENMSAIEDEINGIHANNSLWEIRTFSQRDIAITSGQYYFEYPLPTLAGYTPQFAVLKTATHMTVMWAFSVYRGNLFAQYRSTSANTTGFEVYVWYQRDS